MASRVSLILHVQRILITLRAILVTASWVIHLFATDILLSLLLPISFLFPTLAYNVSSKLASPVWYGIQLIFTHLNGAHITYSGSRLPDGESAIVIANHVSWTDFYMIQALAIRAGMLGRCRWFAKQQLKWVPFLGWGLWAMGMPLVSREWTKDRREMERVFSGVTKNKWPIWLISYSEATRYTPEKYAETISWCKAHDRPFPKHTLYPRSKGFITTVQQLRHTPHIRAVYDLTIAYAHERQFLIAPTIWETLSQSKLSGPWDFHVHVDRHAIENLPDTDEELAKWLETRWIEKGDRLEEMRKALAAEQDWGNAKMD
ncbi:MAG: hypothetical protein M1827_007036 [Pycnora praestabilis]|nr:MAG: hypothetical protein M1827_007036 [Pycnora praestabilis]